MRMLVSWLAVAVAATAVAGPSKLVVVSWDGGADWVMDRLLAEGKLPHLAGLVKRGTAADSTIPPFPSKTAVSHYALFSGTWPRTSYVSGNTSPLMPRSEHTILETQSGFSANQHVTEPLWVTAAKAGKKVLALSAAGAAPPAADQARLKQAGVPLDRYVQFSGFESQLEAATAVPISGLSRIGTVPFVEGEPDPRPRMLTVAETSFTFSDTKDGGWISGPGIDGRPARIHLKAVEANHSLSDWAGPFRISKGSEQGNAWFRLFPAEGKLGVPILYTRATSALKGTQSPEENLRYLNAYGGFHDDPFSPYQAGGLGKPLYEGGSGVAERRVLEAVQLDMEFLKRSFRYGWKTYRPDLVFHYSPQTDNAGHCWMGLLDPESPVYNAQLAKQLWPYYEQVFQLQDQWLGDMMSVSGKDTAFALVSDHGMAASTQAFSVNRVLKDAGLLSVNPDGTINLSATRACAPPWSDFAVVVNSTDWKAGIVPSEAKDQVLAECEAALKNVIDPKTGQAVVTHVWRAREVADVGGGGPAGGDLYLDFVPGTYPSTRAGDPVLKSYTLPRAQGVHGFYPRRRTMNGIFYVGGPGITVRHLPQIPVVDVTPTLCHLMGWPISADAVGTVRDLTGH